MKFEDLPQSVRESISSFEETVTETLKCPKCGNNTVVKRIQMEPSQSSGGRWFVEYCEEKGCKHWDCGFT